MFAHSIEIALADAPGVAATQACLDHSSAALMRTPDDGKALVRALGGAEQVHDRIDDLLQILSAALEDAWTMTQMAFADIPVPQRQEKPRTCGVTMMIDWGTV